MHGRIELGIESTELQEHVTDQGARDRLESSKETAERLAPEDVAEAIAFMVVQPKHANLTQVTIMPTRQSA